ncbi:MAG: hypothetical protein LBH43_02000 [Treponema sp.]|jgi:hypothetical protein|nr:hypothetical protein [Treponema sp.]
MKNTIKLKAIQRMAGLIAFVAITGFSMTACDDGSGRGGNNSVYVLNVESTYDANGDLLDYTEYEYDSKGNRTKVSGYDRNGDLTGYTVYTYKRV